MKSNKAIESTRTVASVASFLLLWSAIAYLMDSMFLPSPIRVARVFAGAGLGGGVYRDALISVGRVLGGYGIAIVVSIPLALAIHWNRWVAGLAGPWISFFRYLPIGALLPVLIVWLGIGEITKISLIALGVVFHAVVGILLALQNVDYGLVELASMLGLSHSDTIVKVSWRAATPEIFDVCRIALGWAWTYVVLAELIAASEGLGAMVRDGQRYFRPERSFAAIVVIGLLGISSDRLFRWAKDRWYPWHARIRG